MKTYVCDDNYATDVKAAVCPSLFSIKASLSLMDLELFLLEYHENGIEPEKVAELFARDSPPGLGVNRVAEVMKEICRDGRKCRLDEIEELFDELRKRQPKPTPSESTPPPPLAASAPTPPTAAKAQPPPPSAQPLSSPTASESMPPPTERQKTAYNYLYPKKKQLT